MAQVYGSTVSDHQTLRDSIAVQEPLTDSIAVQEPQLMSMHASRADMAVQPLDMASCGSPLNDASRAIGEHAARVEAAVSCVDTPDLPTYAGESIMRSGMAQAHPPRSIMQVVGLGTFAPNQHQGQPQQDHHNSSVGHVDGEVQGFISKLLDDVCRASCDKDDANQAVDANRISTLEGGQVFPGHTELTDTVQAAACMSFSSHSLPSESAAGFNSSLGVIAPGTGSQASHNAQHLHSARVRTYRVLRRIAWAKLGRRWMPFYGSR